MRVRGYYVTLLLQLQYRPLEQALRTYWLIPYLHIYLSLILPVKDQPKTFFKAISFYDEPDEENLLSFSLFDSDEAFRALPQELCLPQAIQDR